jgi:uncharacterized delta-60 repeat protein
MTKILFSFFSLVFYSTLFSQPAQQWLSRFNGVGDFSDQYNCVVTDASGNSYLGGYTISPLNRRDYLLVKLDASGNQVWLDTYVGTGGKDDEITAMTIDPSGNIYVTGYSRGFGTGDDVVTIKYNSSGTVLWTAIYDNPTVSQDDHGSAIALDQSGNVLITGYSDVDPGLTENDNFLTIKYSPSGVFTWGVFYNGPTSGEDRAIGIVPGASGAMYVTGRSFSADMNIVTIKYNGSGTQVWMKSFDGGSDDEPVDIAVGPSEKIYVTGKRSNGVDDDMLVLSYSSTGTDLWPGGVLYQGPGGGNDRPSAMAVDPSGNVFLTGKTDIDPSIGINYDYCTVLIDASQNLVWDILYNGIGNGTDEANDILYNNGTITVTGHSDVDPNPSISDYNVLTFTYNTGGAIVNTGNYQGAASLDDDGKALALDANGRYIVAGGSDGTDAQSNALAVQYESSLLMNWDTAYSGAGDNSDNSNALNVDANGNSYVAGYTYSRNSLRDYCVIKIDPQGDTLWTRTFNGTDNANDEANDIKVDNSGNVYVTGYTKETGTDYDVTTIKYSPAGVQLWVAKYNNTLVNQEEEGLKLVLDNLNNVYVAGKTDRDISAVNNQDYLLIKYDNNGLQQWVKTFNGSGDNDDAPVAIGYLSASNAIVLTGTSENFNDDDYVTVCYSTSGTQLWVRSYDGLLGNDRAADMTIDGSERITVTGKKSNGVDYDIATVQYSNAGVENWVNVYNAGANDGEAVAISNDSQGNIYVTGTTTNGIQSNIITFKITSSGSASWSNVYNGTASLDDVPGDILVDGNGYVIIAGYTTVNGPLGSNADILIRKYSSSGNIEWTTTYDNMISGEDAANAIAFDASNNIFITGKSASNTGQRDIVTIKYDSQLTVEELNLGDNCIAFPNPFSQSATVQLLSPKGEFELVLLGMDGKEMARTRSSSGSAIVQKENLSSGMYLYTILIDGSEVGNGKLIVE